MEFNLKRLEDVKFKAKGRWYDAVQVDDFIDEMIEGFSGIIKENEELKSNPVSNDTPVVSESTGVQDKKLTEEIDKLKAELGNIKNDNAGLKEKLEQAQANAEMLKGQAEIKAKKIETEAEKERKLIKAEVQELTAQKGKLLEDIKMLKKFRDDFGASVQEDMKKVMDSIDSMKSKELL